MQIPDIAFALQHSQSSGSQSTQQECSGEQNTEERKSATYLDREKLLTINEISKLIRVLETLDPNLAKELTRYREAVANESIGFTKDIARVIQQVLQKEPQNIEDLQKVAKAILQTANKNIEIPPETKLLIALKQNDFPAAAIAIKRLIQPLQNQVPQTPINQIPQQSNVINTPQQIPQNQQIPLPQNTQVQQTSTNQIPLQSNVINTPQQILQNPQIPLPQNPQVQQTPTNLIPQQSNVTINTPQQILQSPQIPLPQNPQVQQTPTNQIPQQSNVTINSPQQILQSPQVTFPQPLQVQQTPTNQIPQTPLVLLPQMPLQYLQPQVSQNQTSQVPLITSQTLFNALQELKILGTPSELNQEHLQKLEHVILQKTGIEIPKNIAQKLEPYFSEKPRFALTVISPKEIELRPLSHPIIDQPKQLTTHTQQSVTQQQPLTTPQQPTQIAQPIKIPLQENLPALNFLPKNEQREIAFTLHNITNITETGDNKESGNKIILQPWPVSIDLPKNELNYWLRTELPITPEIVQLKNLFPSKNSLPEPAQMKLFATALHELSLQIPNGQEIEKEKITLLQKIIFNDSLNNNTNNNNLEQPVGETLKIQTPQTQQIKPLQVGDIFSQILPSLLRYKPTVNYEGELFKTLPESVKNEFIKEMQNPGQEQKTKINLPQQMEKIVEKILEHSMQLNLKEEHVQTLRQLKEQLQWTRFDQETKPPQEREHIFYFAHNGELQKGHLQIKDDRKKNSKKNKDAVLKFSIETKTKNLGAVHADLVLNKNTLNINLTDEIGTANESVQKERESLAKELSDIGLVLGELNYGKTPKKQNIQIINKPKSTGKLNVLA